MKISNLRVERRPGATRAVASIAWEDCPRPPLELFFETDERGGEDLAAEPEAFVAACVLPAMREGERRVHVEGPVCPTLAEGVADAMALLRSWYEGYRPVAVESSEGFRALVPRQPPRAALLFTGGIDSTHLLASNRSQLPTSHPASFADAVSVFGHLCPATDSSRRWNRTVRASLAERAAQAGMPLIPIETNLWELAPDVQFLSAASLSSTLAAAAHVLRKRWSSISVASSRDIAQVVSGQAFHPLLDPLFSSSALQMRHSSSRLTRLERLRALAEEPGRLEKLLVCLAFPSPPQLNCGECEKCVRTMTALVALGRLCDARLFPVQDVSPAMIAKVPIGPMYELYWTEVLPLLAQRGRFDLVEAIRSRLEEMAHLERWSQEEGWKGRLRRLDRRLFGGSLLKARQRLFPRRSES